MTKISQSITKIDAALTQLQDCILASITRAAAYAASSACADAVTVSAGCSACCIAMLATMLQPANKMRSLFDTIAFGLAGESSCKPSSKAWMEHGIMPSCGIVYIIQRPPLIINRCYSSTNIPSR